MSVTLSILYLIGMLKKQLHSSKYSSAIVVLLVLLFVFFSLVANFADRALHLLLLGPLYLPYLFTFRCIVSMEQCQSMFTHFWAGEKIP